jgi:hypothetical protein
MAEGINIITNSEPVIVEGAKELIESYNKGEINREDLYRRILDLDVVYIDRQKFKDKEGIPVEDE